MFNVDLEIFNLILTLKHRLEGSDILIIEKYCIFKSISFVFTPHLLVFPNVSQILSNSTQCFLKRREPFIPILKLLVKDSYILSNPKKLEKLGTYFSNFMIPLALS